MKIRATAIFLLAGGLALAASDMGYAQTTLGGAKPQQNRIGGVAKPPPVVGGAAVHAYSPPPPKPVVNLANKPGTQKPGATTPSALAATNTRVPNAPVMTPIPNKDGKVANLKCVSGACMSRGTKP